MYPIIMTRLYNIWWENIETDRSNIWAGFFLNINKWAVPNKSGHGAFVCQINRRYAHSLGR